MTTDCRWKPNFASNSTKHALCLGLFPGCHTHEGIIALFPFSIFQRSCLIVSQGDKYNVKDMSHVIKWLRGVGLVVSFTSSNRPIHGPMGGTKQSCILGWMSVIQLIRRVVLSRRDCGNFSDRGTMVSLPKGTPAHALP